MIRAVGQYKKMLFFCSEGVSYLVFALVIALVITVIAWHRPSVFMVLLALISWLIASEIGYFFRDPARQPPPGPGLVLAPADGKIIDIRHLEENDVIKGPCTRVSIFMNIFDVHVNRAPISGKITYCRYNPGKFISAFKEKSSLDNEQVAVGITGREDGTEVSVRVNLIAGFIARRIVLWKDLGCDVSRGERISLIKFGSRADIYLPVGVKAAVNVGDRVRAGETVIGKCETENAKRKT